MARSAVAIGSIAATRFVEAGAVIVQVRDTAVGSPAEVLKAVEIERQKKSPFVPMLLSTVSGVRWVPFGLE